MSVVSSTYVGLCMTMCTLVGQKIGECNIEGAKFYYKSVNIVSAVACVAILVFTMLFFKPIFSSFTSDEGILSFMDPMLPMMLLGLTLDHWQCILGGALRAL